MTSLRYRGLETLLRLSKSNRVIAKAIDGAPPRSETCPKRLVDRSERMEVEGRDVWIIHPTSGASERAYVHFHGGAFMLGFMALHFGLAEKLSDLSGLSVCLPDYPLAPAAQVGEITAFADRVYEAALKRWGKGNVKLGGGSAGGNLALALALHRKSKGLSQPAHLLLMSPWVDLEMAHPANDGPSAEVCFTDAADLRRAAALYAGDLPLRDARVSPSFADVSGLAPMTIVTGDVDLLHTDILSFAEKARASGVLSKLAVYGTLGHIFMLYPTPDRVSALIEMGDILRR